MTEAGATAATGAAVEATGVGAGPVAMMTPPTARAVSNAPTIPTPMMVDLDDEPDG